ncbi:MAG: hypothetical protein H7Y03_03460 [Chitinophagaceae bacterium]|nr:hypothetical protein [Chitinophagaceae bacterium]
MIKPLPFFPLLTLLMFSQLQAQKSVQLRPKPGDTFVRINPLGLIDLFDHNLSAGAGYRFNDRWAIAADAGWVFYSQYVPGVKQASGFILRPSIRRYLGSGNKWYLEGVFHYKQVKYQAEGWLERSLVNDVPTYQEYTKYSARRKTLGFYSNLGLIWPAFRNSSWWIELYAGLGIHYQTFDLTDEPNSRIPDAEVDAGFSLELSSLPKVHPAFPVGIRLVRAF